MFKAKKLLLSLLILLIVCIAGVFYLYPKQKQPGSLAYLIQSNGQVTDDVVRLLGWTGVRIDGDPLPPDPKWPQAKLIIPSRYLIDVVAATNGDLDKTFSWRQKPKEAGIKSPPERWEMSGDFTPEQVKNIVDIYFTNLTMGESLPPPQIAYDGVLFLGAALPRVRLRLAHLNQLMKELEVYGPVYVLTGERKLADAVDETGHHLLQTDLIPIKDDWTPPNVLPTTEDEMIKLVFDQSKGTFTNDIIFINAAKRPGETRATREGTTIEWLKHSPEDGSYLAIANQPYNLNQMLVIKRVLLQEGRPNIHVDVAGSPISEKEVNDYRNPQKVAVLLDNLNRIFHELKLIKAQGYRIGDLVR